jgi:hypothetical protein
VEQGDTVVTTWGHRRSAAIAVIACAAVLGLAAPAQADDRDEHCIVLIDDGSTVCAATLEDADEAFTTVTGYTRVADEGARGALVVYSLVTLYPNNGYGGSSYTITRSSACNGSTVSGISDLATIGMNNVISSFQTYGSCQARLYDGTGYSGSTYGYATSSANVGALNDLASSVRVR